MGQLESVNSENLVRHKTSGVYYLRASVAGKIICKSLKTDQLRIAKIKRDTLLAELRQRAGAATKRKYMSLGDLIVATEGYYGSQPSYVAKPKSLKYRMETLKVIRKTLPDRSVASWTAADLERWWVSPDISRYSATRRNGMLGTVRQMMRLAIKMGGRFDDPSAGLSRVPVRSAKITPPARADFPRIVESIRAQKKRMSEEAANFVEFLAYSGVRVGEARAVCWEDVLGKSITITGGLAGTKNHEVRVVPIIPAMAGLLARMRTEGVGRGPLFSMVTPRLALENACKRLGIGHLKVHDLRHLFATTCIESGVDIPTLSRWLGHKDGGVLALKTYGHLRDEHSQMQAAKVSF